MVIGLWPTWLRSAPSVGNGDNGEIVEASAPPTPPGAASAPSVGNGDNGEIAEADELTPSPGAASARPALTALTVKLPGHPRAATSRTADLTVVVSESLECPFAICVCPFCWRRLIHG
jgi:hypothetical protein